MPVSSPISNAGSADLPVRTRTPPGLYGRLRECVGVLVLAPVLSGLAGCTAVQSTATSTQVRIIDASPDAGGLDIYAGTSALAYNLGFGTISSYVALAPATYTFAADTAGSKQVLTSAKATVVTGKQYTILINNVSADLGATVLTDQAQSAPAGEISLRFLDEATAVSAVDIYLIPSGQTLLEVSAVLTDVAFGSNSGYVNVPSGTYKIVMVPTGTVPTSTTVATYTGSSVGYTSGSATTVILLDQKLLTTPGIQVISTTDYTPPSATS